MNVKNYSEWFMLTLIVGLRSILLGCSKDKATNDEPEIRDVIFPLAIGNSWTYRTTTYSQGQPDTTYEFSNTLIEYININNINLYEYGVISDNYINNDDDGLYHTVAFYDSIHSSRLWLKYPGQVGDT